MLDAVTNWGLTGLVAGLVAVLLLGLCYRLMRRSRSPAGSPSRDDLLQDNSLREFFAAAGRDQRLPVARSQKLAGDTADRPTEDDIAKSILGEQGIPGQPPKRPVMSADELQISRTLDPGHTA